MRRLLPYLDDILVLLGLVSIVTASYFVGAVLGTYVLGIAFLVAALFAGIWLKSPAAVKLIQKFQKRK